MAQRVRGLTLVEVLVTIAIISIGSSIILVSVGNGRNEQYAKGAARQLSAAMRDVQNDALTGKNVSDDTSCDFRVLGVGIGGTSVTFQYAKRVNESCDANAVPTTLWVMSLSDGATFSAVSPEIRFVVPRGAMVDNAGNTLTNTVRYEITRGGAVWSVCVYPGGRIEETSGSTCPT